MGKLKPIKPRLGQRIVAAIRAIKGEPWPAQIVYQLPKIERHNIQAFCCQHVTCSDFNQLPAAEILDKEIREEMAAELCTNLLQAGAIEITTEPADPAVYGPFSGTMYRAKVRVAMPEKKED